MRRVNKGSLISSSEIDRQPFFSPDGLWVGYYSFASVLDERGLEKIPVGGGPTPPIAKLPVTTWRASWGDDGILFFATAPDEFDTSTYVVRIDRQGEETPVWSEGPGVWSARVSPDGKRLAASLRGPEGPNPMVVYDRNLSSKKPSKTVSKT